MLTLPLSSDFWDFPEGKPAAVIPGEQSLVYHLSDFFFACSTPVPMDNAPSKQSNQPVGASQGRRISSEERFSHSRAQQPLSGKFFFAFF
jgi:hypothetical protein